LFLLTVVASTYALAQTETPGSDVYRVGPGVIAPKVLRKVEPTYSAQARAAGVQGTVVLELVVSELGRATDIVLVSPVGFGLDERAQHALAQWEFQPGTRDGRPVKTRAVVEVNFRFLQTWYDEKAERRRTDFNIALALLQRNDGRSLEHAVETMRKLARQDLPAAMFVVAIWMEEGKLVPKDSEQAQKFLAKAAEKNYGPALYEVGRRRLEGHGVPREPAEGLKLIREAAVLGSKQAQFYLGAHYETGNVVEQDRDRARRYFRLCAAAGEAVCQFRLGAAIIADPASPERDRVQAIAWLELASERGLAQARSLLDAERPKLSAEQTARVKDWKPRLTPKQ
jgi:TonB family protein